MPPSILRYPRGDMLDRQKKMIFDALRHFRLPHRLMDFNNLPETRFEDIHNVLRAAATRVAARLNAARARDPADSRSPVHPRVRGADFTFGYVAAETVSELCHMPPESLGQHRHLRGHTDAR